VTAEIEGFGQTLQAQARTILAGLPAGDPAPALRQRIRLVSARHPGVAFSLLDRGRVLASAGGAPATVPAWLKEQGFSGLVEVENGERLRTAWTEGGRTLFLEVPVDASLFADLEGRMGIHLLTSGGRVSRTSDSKGLRIEVQDDESSPIVLEERRSGFAFVATPERVDWATGERELDALTFQFQPWELVRRSRAASTWRTCSWSPSPRWAASSS
jgi:hypothetical protein